MSHVFHHLHKRKRIHQQLEQFPHPNTFKRFMDHMIYVIGIVAPLMGSLQAIKIWKEQTAAGIALPTFVFNVIANVFWLLYGILHKEKPIIVMYTLWFIVNVTIVVGTLLYG